jgi:hypothetical protein
MSRPDHAADDAVFGDDILAAVERLDRGAIAQNRDRVGHAGDFAELVRNQNRRDALRLELQQKLKQGVAVALVEAGGRLVQDEQAHFFGSDLAISTSCCLPTPISVISVLGDSCRPTFSRSSWVRWWLHSS